MKRNEVLELSFEFALQVIGYCEQLEKMAKEPPAIVNISKINFFIFIILFVININEF